jgi:hypothetical protein
MKGKTVYAVIKIELRDGRAGLEFLREKLGQVHVEYDMVKEVKVLKLVDCFSEINPS